VVDSAGARRGRRGNVRARSGEGGKRGGGDQGEEASVGVVPGGGVGGGVVRGEGGRAADDAADVGKGMELTGGESLDEDVAEGGGLDRSGEDTTAGGVGGHLAEEGIASAAADDVDDRDRLAGDHFETLDDPAVFEGEAFQDAAHGGARAGRGRLAALDAEVGEAGGHVSWGDKGRVIGVDEVGKGGRSFGEADKVGVGVALSLEPPGAATLLEEPESHNVLEEANGIEDTNLVREIGGHGGGRQDGAGGLDADEGPGAAGDVGPIVANGGDGGDGGGGVVGADGDDGRARRET